MGCRFEPYLWSQFHKSFGNAASSRTDYWASCEPQHAANIACEKGVSDFQYPDFDFGGWIAQSVEQRTENPCVGGSIPSPATIFPMTTNNRNIFRRVLSGGIGICRCLAF